MVKGIVLFRTFFKDYSENYILIGGAACDVHLSQAGLMFRATKDLDIVLVVELLENEFVKRFWEFVKNGVYETQQKSEGARKYYRFIKPTKNEYPFQLELFARNPDLLDLADDTHLTPIPVDEDLSSLSAILMNDDYYKFTLNNSIVESDLHLATVETLICLKAKAFLDLRARKEKGTRIDEKDSKKHKNDVIRLAALLSADNSFKLPDPIHKDIEEFLSVLEKEPPDVRAIAKTMGLHSLDINTVVNQIEQTFHL